MPIGDLGLSQADVAIGLDPSQESSWPTSDLIRASTELQMSYGPHSPSDCTQRLSTWSATSATVRQMAFSKPGINLLSCI
jgi:hypothetical protein